MDALTRQALAGLGWLEQPGRDADGRAGTMRTPIEQRMKALAMDTIPQRRKATNDAAEQ